MALFETNVPVVNVNPANANVPDVNVVAAVTTIVSASPKVVVPDVLLIVKIPNVVLALLIIVPVPTIVAVNAVKVPLLLNVNAFKFKVVPAIVNAVVPKSSLLNQLPVLSVTTAVPLPVSVKFGDVVAEPPVLPNARVLVIDASV